MERLQSMNKITTDEGYEFELVKKINVQVYRAKMPESIHGTVTEDQAGKHMILINSEDSPDGQACAFLHEMLHLWNDDFNRVAVEGVQAVEARTHRQLRRLLELALKE